MIESKLEFEVGKKDVQTSGPQDNTDKGNGGDTGKESTGKTDKVKTGDDMEVGKYAVLGVGTGLVILGCAVMTEKKKKKNQ